MLVSLKYLRKLALPRWSVSEGYGTSPWTFAVSQAGLLATLDTLLILRKCQVLDHFHPLLLIIGGDLRGQLGILQDNLHAQLNLLHRYVVVVTKYIYT